MSAIEKSTFQNPDHGLLDGPFRTISIFMPPEALRTINSFSGNETFGGVVRLLCYGFLMAWRERGSRWQIDACVHDRTLYGPPQSLTKTTVKIPDGMCEEIEKICAGTKVTLSSFIRSVACMSASEMGASDV